MHEDTPQQSPTENPGWLATLQQDSWQAEVLISGGGIVGVISLLDQVGDVREAMWHGTSLFPGIANSITTLLIFTSFILAQSFILHLILRGYWVGLIGLNIVFPQGVNQEKLAFKGKFKSFIKGNSNTPYLVKLDGLCSLIFSFTFFFIFAIAGFFLFVLFSTGIFFMAEELTGSKLAQQVASRTMLVIGLLTLIDFFTFGYLKKVRWISLVYHPIHYIVSRITLSFLYRRLYYSIVSNIRPVYIILGLSAEIIVIALLITFSFTFSEDISTKSSGKDSFLELEEEIVDGNSLRFSFSHFPWLEDELYSEWTKSHGNTKATSFKEIPKEDKIDLIGSLYIITIDSIRADSLAWMTTSREILGFETLRLSYLADVGRLARGRHELGIRLRLKQSEYTYDSINYLAKAHFMMDK